MKKLQDHVADKTPAHHIYIFFKAHLLLRAPLKTTKESIQRQKYNESLEVAIREYHLSDSYTCVYEDITLSIYK